VFTDAPFTGNGLIVLFGSPGEVRAQALISVTAEMRQFELIIAEFQPGGGSGGSEDLHGRGGVAVRGQPVIGAAAARHERMPLLSPHDHGLRDRGARDRRAHPAARGYYEAE